MTEATTTSVLSRKLRLLFEMMNTDHDGHLTRAQLLALTGRLADSFHQSTQIRKIRRLDDSLRLIWDRHLRYMDFDGDGEIDPQEYERGIRKAGSGEGAEEFLAALGEMVAAWLDICDVHGNGVIDIDEYAQMYGSTFGTPREQLDEAFRRLDRNGKGVLAPDEIQSAVREFFTSDDPASPGNNLFGPI
ncbi:EF-hand domain-containing protein [Embleya sp. AB8]|uniref:EF-hand domain-containing protein n=1 Tax=Embleya sp. AB8 TaxID=3156304 RepID=UPI003C7763AE